MEYARKEMENSMVYNYTDRATAVCRRSDCQLLRTEGFRVVRAADPYGRILGFLDRSCYFFFHSHVNFKIEKAAADTADLWPPGLSTANGVA
jgi:hypothetical protein